MNPRARIATTNGSPAAGQIQLFDSYRRALEAGVHTITATSHISDPTHHASFPSFAASTQAFEVIGPHFTIDPSIIHSTFPPSDGSADYTDFLPQIVLSGRLLPWQRDLANAPDGAPWVALLLFNPSEVSPVAGVDKTFATTGTVGDFLNPPSAFATPVGEADPAVANTSACRYVDLPMTLFRTIAPKSTELAWLTHWRNVNSGAGIGGDSENGVFSAVIGNRFPSSNEDNVVHLVSLAGLGGYLPDHALPDAATMIRLVSLASWRFASPADAESFGERVSALNANVLTLPVTAPAQATKPEQDVVDTVAKGFVPVTYRRREGAQTAGWYRGPLMPVAVLEPSQMTAFQTSDAALIYDPASGMFELSYAVAWQTGRLLALANQKFCVDLLVYRNGLKNLLFKLHQRITLARRFPTTLALAATPMERLEPKAVSAAAHQFLREHFAKLVVDPAQPLLPRARDKFQLAEPWAAVPGVLPADELAALFANGGDPLTNLLERVFDGDVKGTTP